MTVDHFYETMSDNDVYVTSYNVVSPVTDHAQVHTIAINGWNKTIMERS